MTDFPLATIADYTAALDDVRSIAERAAAAGAGEHVAELIKATERALRLCPATSKSVARREVERQILGLFSATVAAQLRRAGVLAGEPPA